MEEEKGWADVLGGRRLPRKWIRGLCGWGEDWRRRRVGRIVAVGFGRCVEEIEIEMVTTRADAGELLTVDGIVEVREPEL